MDHPIDLLLAGTATTLEHLFPLDVPPGHQRLALEEAYPKTKDKSLIVTLYGLKRFDVIDRVLEQHHSFWCSLPLLELVLAFFTTVLRDARERHNSMSPEAFRDFYDFKEDVVPIGSAGHLSWLIRHLQVWCKAYRFNHAAFELIGSKLDINGLFLVQEGREGAEAGELLSALDLLVRFYDFATAVKGVDVQWVFKLLLTRRTDPRLLNRPVLVAGRSIRSTMNHQGTRPAGSFTRRFVMYTPIICALVRELAIRPTYTAAELADMANKATIIVSLIECKCEYGEAYDLICLMTDGGFGSAHPPLTKERISFDTRMKVRVAMERHK